MNPNTERNKLERFIKDNTKLMHVIDCRLTIKQYMTDNELLSSVKVSLRDNVSMKRMTYPCRGLFCQHIQCFDLSVYTFTNHMRQLNEFRCPLCHKYLLPSKLFVDSVFLTILKLYPDQEYVILYPDEIYGFEVTKSLLVNSNAQQNVIELLDSTDEENVKTPSNTYKPIKNDNLIMDLLSDESVQVNIKATSNTVVPSISDMRYELMDLCQLYDLSTVQIPIFRLSEMKVTLDDMINFLNHEFNPVNHSSITPLINYNIANELIHLRPIKDCNTIPDLRELFTRINGIGKIKANAVFSDVLLIVKAKVSVRVQAIEALTPFLKTKDQTTVLLMSLP